MQEERITTANPGEVHKTRNLFSGKYVFVHMIPLGGNVVLDSQLRGNENQAHLNSSEGLLSIYESFHDGERYILVSEQFGENLTQIRSRNLVDIR